MTTKYEALKAACDALAVENAGFKHALSVILEHVDVTDKGQAGVVAMIANDELLNSETPATDAALAAIRDAVLDRVIVKLGALGSPDFTLMAVQALKNELREAK
ncbi:hypothetical protein SIPHO4S_00016 [Serratia phage Tsm2]|uniref:Uncharacterized protein n=1 Tax=Serratia phage Tsm2 TaxID=2787014 RepID=A0A7S9SNU2_9CAUD|nr:hypothetical protein PF629_gp16 [Serratia phage Tsm2]QPI13712.1 hypothetical protein SIPHO4S_00016 [Serratia phage Tsm2]